MLLIPVGGTIAAVIAVAMARGERDHPLYPIVTEPPERTAARDVTDGPLKGTREAKTDPKTPAAPVIRRYLMDVREDGSFFVTAVTRDKDSDLEPIEHESMEKFLATAAPEGGPKPTVHVYTTSANVTAEALEKVAKQLRERCEVVVQKG